MFRNAGPISVESLLQERVHIFRRHGATCWGTLLFPFFDRTLNNVHALINNPGNMLVLDYLVLSILSKHMSQLGSAPQIRNSVNLKLSKKRKNSKNCADSAPHLPHHLGRS